MEQAIQSPIPVARRPALQVKARTSCRVCGNTSLTTVVSLGNHCISNFVEDERPASAAPLELVLCNVRLGGCGLLQLRHTINQELLYRNYWYRSGVNATMRKALADVANAAEQLVSLQSGNTVIDIGSNDNTLLRSYKTCDLQKVGFEPATNLMPYARDANITVVNDFFAASVFQRLFPGHAADVITSIAMFYDLDDPNVFVTDIRTCLHPHGVWIIQMMYLPIMLTNNIFDNICHEHLTYYSLHSLEFLLRRHGLKVIDAELNDVNGGSIRAYIAYQNNTSLLPFPGAEKRLTALREQEYTLRLHTTEPYEAFAHNIACIKDQLTDFIRSETAHGKRVYVYGASTKGNTLLQYFALDRSLIHAAAERNQDKWGKKTVGTLIPIISEEQARAEQPDYFLVLPWHFLPEFIERERNFLQAGGKFIVPLPEFKVIGAEVLS